MMLSASRCVLDLGSMPPSNRLPVDDGNAALEPRFPLRVLLDEEFWFLRLDTPTEATAHFNEDYPYFTSASTTAVEHARRLAGELSDRFASPLGRSPRVIEIGSNDGYLLQFFSRRGALVLGVEPSRSVADAARAKGIESLTDFFGPACARRIAAERGRFDLLIANNVVAHTPDVPGMLEGMRCVLADEGVVSIEVASLDSLVKDNLYDTVYHEHYSYFSAHALVGLLARAGLEVFDAVPVPTHGGSIRVLASPRGNGRHPVQPSVAEILRRETAQGVTTFGFYAEMQRRADAHRDAVRKLFSDLRSAGRRAAGYGAPAKASTLLNFCGAGPETFPFVADASPGKQGRRIPGVGIPIRDPLAVDWSAVDDVVVFPWNIRDEIVAFLDPRLRPSARAWVCFPEIARVR